MNESVPDPMGQGQPLGNGAFSDPYRPMPGWDDSPGLVRAAGGVLWRNRDGVVQVLLVHRGRYDDWSFPKGKLQEHESHEDGALRETEEESGYRCILGEELRCTRYIDGKGRPKTVRYWQMTVAGGEFRPNSETDEVRWLGLHEARVLMSYERDMAVLDHFEVRALR